MFTWLAREGILAALDWAFAVIIPHMKQKKRNFKGMIQVSKSKWLDKDNRLKHNVGWHHSSSRDEYIVFSPEELKLLVRMDFANSYFQMGDLIISQIHGCPIGGFLSSPLARLYCIHDEAKLFRKLTNDNLQCNFFGVRQMDDLLLLIAINHADRKQKNKIRRYIRSFRHAQHTDAPPIYTGGLELEEEQLDTKGRYVQLTFSGSDLCIGVEPHFGFHSKPHFKNWESLMKDQKVKAPRLPPLDSYIDKSVREITVRGMLHLFKSQSSDSRYLEIAVHQLLYECQYPRALFKQSLRIMEANSPHTWQPIYKRFRQPQTSNNILKNIIKSGDWDNLNASVSTFKRRLWQ